MAGDVGLRARRAVPYRKAQYQRHPGRVEVAVAERLERLREGPVEIRGERAGRTRRVPRAREPKAVVRSDRVERRPNPAARERRLGVTALHDGPRRAQLRPRRERALQRCRDVDRGHLDRSAVGGSDLGEPHRLVGILEDQELEVVLGAGGRFARGQELAPPTLQLRARLSHLGSRHRARLHARARLIQLLLREAHRLLANAYAESGGGEGPVGLLHRRDRFRQRAPKGRVGLPTTRLRDTHRESRPVDRPIAQKGLPQLDADPGAVGRGEPRKASLGLIPRGPPPQG